MLSVAEDGGDVRTYRYDANGNRVARVLNSNDNGMDSVDKVTGSEDNTTISEVNADKSYKETADYYYYDYEDRLVEIVLHNGKVFTYGYDGEGNRLWRTYSQYPLVKPPVDEGERVEIHQPSQEKIRTIRKKIQLVIIRIRIITVTEIKTKRKTKAIIKTKKRTETMEREMVD